MKRALVSPAASGFIGLVILLLGCEDAANPVMPLHPILVPIDAATRTVARPGGGNGAGLDDGGAPGSLGSDDPGPGSGPGGAATPIGLPECTETLKKGCCYEDSTFNAPKCWWTILAPQASVWITSAYTQYDLLDHSKDKKVDLPAPLELRNVTPASVGSMQECQDATVGFTLSGPGLRENTKEELERSLYGEFTSHSEYGSHLVRSDQTWKEFSNLVGTARAVAPINTDGTAHADGGVLAPTEKMGAYPNLCDQFAETQNVQYAISLRAIYFTMNGTKYEVHFDTDPVPIRYLAFVSKAF
jgi:hypothetical protein